MKSAADILRTYRQGSKQLEQMQSKSGQTSKLPELEPSAANSALNTNGGQRSTPRQHAPVYLPVLDSKVPSNNRLPDRNPQTDGANGNEIGYEVISAAVNRLHLDDEQHPGAHTESMAKTTAPQLILADSPIRLDTAPAVASELTESIEGVQADNHTELISSDYANLEQLTETDDERVEAGQNFNSATGFVDETSKRRLGANPTGNIINYNTASKQQSNVKRNISKIKEAPPVAALNQNVPTDTVGATSPRQGRPKGLGGRKASFASSTAHPYSEPIHSVAAQIGSPSPPVPTKNSHSKKPARHYATDLSSIGLPSGLVESYRRLGVTQMYRWQADCLHLEDVMSGQRNLVYSAPTGSGKTFVAEVLVFKKIMETRKRALIVEPFVSAVAEKVSWFKRLYRPFKLKVGGYYSNARTRFPIERADVAICTLEKANAAVNKMVDDQTLKNIGIIVVDELHLIGEENRGYLLELLLTKIRYLRGGDIQVVGMSATLPNLDLVSRWLKAHLFITTNRPVPLQEYILIKNKVLDKNLAEVRTIPIVAHPKDPDLLVPLCFEVVAEGKSVLVFCPSKDSCEKCAVNIASLISVSMSADLVQRRKDLTDRLLKTPGGLDPSLELTIPVGIGFHHAGLTLEEREIIEAGFRSGALSILCATSTLASGVNLPAKRIIIRSPYIGRSFMDNKSYQQMRGRAGRRGDSTGECFVLCKHSERERAKHLLQDELEPISSCLTPSRCGLSRALLEVIAARVAQSERDLLDYTRNTLFHCEINNSNQSTAALQQALSRLSADDMITVREDDQHWHATHLGQAVFASALSPDEGLQVYRELEKAMRRYVLRGDLYSVYHVTPTYFSIEPDWPIFMRLYCAMDDVQRDTAEVIGIQEGFLAAAAQGYIAKSTQQQRDLAQVHRRFWATLMLQDLINEHSFSSVLSKYRVNRGTLQMLQITASTFAGMVTTFCQRLRWNNLQLLIHQFQDRLSFGVHSELIDLCRLPSMKSTYARLLYDRGGYKTADQLAGATADSLIELFRQYRPYYNRGTTTMLDGRSLAAVEAMEKRLAQSLVREAVSLERQQREQRLNNNNNQDMNGYSDISSSSSSSSSSDDDEDSLSAAHANDQVISAYPPHDDDDDDDGNNKVQSEQQSGE